MSPQYNVIIIGGGLVGLLLATRLGQQGLRVALLEARDLQPIDLKPNEYQLRVSAINIAVKKMFSDLEVWDEVIASNRTSSFEKMFVWDSLGRGEIHFDCTEIGTSSLGFILENTVIQNVLLNELKNYSNVTLIEQAIPLDLAMGQHHINLKFKLKNTEQIISSELIVGADGANSWVKEKTNIDSITWPYDHQALVTTVETELPHQKTAWQCFLSDGPLALLPLFHPHICSIVWSSHPQEIKRLQNLSDEAFSIEITNAFEHRLGKIKKISPTVTVPLHMRHAKKYINQRIALVGDAAHTIHPLAGQGINLGFADAWLLAQLILDAKLRGKNCGEYTLLRKYERSRKSDNWIMIYGMEFFKRLFQSEGFLPIQMRSLGLRAVDKMKLVKNQFIFRAMGE